MAGSARGERKDSVRIITDIYGSLSAGERKIADYVIAHVPEISDLSARALGKEVGTSEASVTRFCQSCGYKGFREFKIALARGSAAHDDWVVDLAASGDGLEQTVRRVCMASVQAIRSTVESLDFQALQRAARAVAACRRLHLFGFGTSGVVCQDAAVKFSRLSIPTFPYSDPHLCAAAFGLLDGRDVVVAMSHSGGTREAVELAAVAQAHGATTVGVTTYPGSPLAAHCAILLKTMTRESPMHSAAITSRMSQLAVVDSLFIAVASVAHPEALGSLAKVSETIRVFRD